MRDLISRFQIDVATSRRLVLSFFEINLDEETVEKSSGPAEKKT